MHGRATVYKTAWQQHVATAVCSTNVLKLVDLDISVKFGYMGSSAATA
jgi:hypothetical protein